jgi:hypothetical protein
MRESEQKLGNGLHHRILEYFNQGWVIEDGWRVLALGSYPQTTRVKNIYTGEIFEVGLMIAPAEPIPGFDDRGDADEATAAAVA